jgi:hypothetical protein
MRSRNLRAIRLTVALLFFLIIVFVHFFHTEKGPFPDPFCPACQLQHSALSAALIIFVLLPLLAILLLVNPASGPKYESQFARIVPSRAPPVI